MSDVSGSGRAFLAVLVAICLLVALYIAQAGITARRESEGITETDIFEAMTPETFATTVLLAGFRGVLADMLWLRSIKMEDEKQWFELQALYELITQLQPDFEQVWDFAAWNLAYNIFFEAGSLDEKWDWLDAGKALLVEGIARNPRSYFLRWKLGELYMRKYADRTYPAFAERLRRQTGKHPYEHALQWFTDASDPGRFPAHTHLQDLSMAQIHDRLAELAHSESRLEDEIAHLEEAIGWWWIVLRESPDNLVGDKRVSQLSGRLAPAYSAVAKQAGSGEEAERALAKLREVADRTLELWGGYVEGDLERLLVAAVARTELVEALAAVHGEQAAMAEVSKAEELLNILKTQAAEMYAAHPLNPEFLFYGGEAARSLARCALIRHDEGAANEFHVEALKAYIMVNEQIMGFGNSIKRVDYLELESLVGRLIPEVQDRVKAYLGTAAQRPAKGGGV